MSNKQMDRLSDFDIIESIKKGNRNDFSLLVDRYKNKAYSLLVRMLKNRMEADELLQDSFMKAYNNLSGFKGEAKFSTWFYRIVYNTALTRLSIKNRKIVSEMSSIDEHYELISELDYISPEQTDTAGFIRKLISKLPQNYAVVLTLFYLEGMSCEEISRIMNISVSNVKVILHRSRSALKEIILKNNLAGDLI